MFYTDMVEVADRLDDQTGQDKHRESIYIKSCFDVTNFARRNLRLLASRRRMRSWPVTERGEDYLSLRPRSLRG